MKTKSLILLVGAITLAAGTALVARALMRPAPPVTVVKEVQVPSAARQVLVANVDLAPGQFVDGAAMAWRELPGAELRAGHLIAASEADRREMERELYGATVRRGIAKNELFSRDLLVRAGEPGFLSAVLTPGMRAVSIPTSAVASNAGLVTAGDWVDVILSLERSSLEQQATIGASPNSSPVSPFAQLASQTILKGVRVLALNSNTTSITPTASAANAAPAASDGESNSGRGTARSARSSAAAPRVAYESLTLEVTPAQAEQLAVAREVGTLQVALRGVREELQASAPPRSVTRLVDATAIFAATANTGASAPAVTVKTFHGTQQATQTFASTP